MKKKNGIFGFWKYQLDLSSVSLENRVGHRPAGRESVSRSGAMVKLSNKRTAFIGASVGKIHNNGTAYGNEFGPEHVVSATRPTVEQSLTARQTERPAWEHSRGLQMMQPPPSPRPDRCVAGGKGEGMRDNGNDRKINRGLIETLQQRQLVIK